MKNKGDINFMKKIIFGMIVCVLMALMLIPVTAATPISTAQELDNVRNNLSGDYILIADIDLSGYANWTPIGTVSTQFTGTFDGDGHVIENLTIYQPSSDVQGLFGYVGNVSGVGTVQNLGIVGGSVEGKRYVGGVAGLNNGTIANCYNTGTVTGNVTGTYSHVGGVAGLNNGGTITNCYNTGSVTGNVTGNVTDTYSRVGGVAGYNNNNGTIENCYNTGAVTGNVTGNVTGTYSHVGGVAGENNGGTITNCYNTGAVTGTGTGTGSVFIGGVVGYDDGGTITNCYWANDVADAPTYGIGNLASNDNAPPCPRRR